MPLMREEVEENVTLAGRIEGKKKIVNEKLDEFEDIGSRTRIRRKKRVSKS